ncbi:hypothetical protein JS531_06740 [Bifidobacterium sp. CP2]|uniref:DUF6055 domain-containing protein n=1 Tax=Bifidobacterium sp. CP2 TaxID=2809025 RepID=UPI001BDBDE43|nr:DUF6055 domain-containing protein [Bifidobacterium sp. CP2]MBT1181660.1 hypothetical protein [Bifidobacterium sp. CP2]
MPYQAPSRRTSQPRTSQPRKPQPRILQRLSAGALAIAAAIGLVAMPSAATAATATSTTAAAATTAYPNYPDTNTGCTPGTWTAPDPSTFGTSSDIDPNDKTRTELQYETDHFAFYWTSDVKTDDGKPVDVNEIQTGAKTLEQDYDFYTDAQGIDFPEPYCTSATKYKIVVMVNNQQGLAGGWTENGTHYPAMWMLPHDLKDAWGVAHELTHTLQFGVGVYNGSYVTPESSMYWIFESVANWMAFRATGSTNVHCSAMIVDNPHINFGSSRDMYCNWPFFEYAAETYGPRVVSDIWRKSQSFPDFYKGLPENPMQIMRLAMGMTQAQFNDVFAQWAMHDVTWDYPAKNADGATVGEAMAKSYGSVEDASVEAHSYVRTNRLTYLDQVSDADGKPVDGRYRVLTEQAPQQGGYNIVKLDPQTTSQTNQTTTVTVGFHGIVQDKAGTDAFPSFAGENDNPKTVPVPDSGWRWGLVAVGADGTPRYSELQSSTDGFLTFDTKSDDKALYLVVSGAPSTMQNYLWNQKDYSIYRYPYYVDLDGATPADNTAGLTGGHRHANGGGWVSDDATVADTAYVGPHARVFGGTVSGNARIEDHVTMYGGTVSGNAVVKGISVLLTDASVSGDAVVDTNFQAFDYFNDSPRLSGTAQVRGAAEYYPQGEVSKGVYYGVVDDGAVSSGFGSLTALDEVTRTPEAADYLAKAWPSTRKALQSLVDKASAVQQSAYTSDSFAALAAALSAARAALADASTTQSSLTATSDALQRAFDGLVAVGSGSGSGSGDGSGDGAKGDASARPVTSGKTTGLSKTGSDVAALFAAAAGLAAIGLGGVALARRRRD